MSDEEKQIIVEAAERLIRRSGKDVKFVWRVTMLNETEIWINKIQERDAEVELLRAVLGEIIDWYDYDDGDAPCSAIETARKMITAA